jgi:hypothetical protein
MRHSISPNASKRSIGRSQSSPTQADLAARARRNVPVTISFPHPFAWWRTLRAEQFRGRHVQIARRLLAKSAIIGETHWFLAAAGDAAVAIGVALRVQKRAGSTLALLDLAMTAVACAALEGNLNAALLLSSTLERRREIDARCAALSDSWLAYRPRKRPPRSPSC